MSSPSDTKPVVEDDMNNNHLRVPINASNTNESPDLAYSFGIPQEINDEYIRESEEDYSHHDRLDSPPSPRTPHDTQIDDNLISDNLISDKYIHRKKTLSKKLFNIEHYIMIPIMFLLSFFVYYDRGGLASALDNAQEQLLNDNAFKGGAVASCYLFGFCFTSPLFALLGSKYPPLKMSSIGMTVWCIGAFLTGMPAPSFISPFVWIAGARLLTGIGEASFLAFAGTIIDIIAPDASRALWLGTFYMGIPLGYAMGYGVGGTIAGMTIYVTNNCDNTWYEKEDVTDCNESWRAIFITEIFLVLPVCIILFCIKQPPNMLVIKQSKDELIRESMNIHKQTEELHDAAVCTKISRLLTNKTFVLTAIGYALQTFVTGTFGVEAITYLQKVYKWSSSKAGIVFGILTFISGVGGSVFGGFILDKMKSKLEHDSPAYMYCKPALQLLVVLSFMAFPFAFIVVIWNTIPIFIIGVFLTEFMIFASQGPVNNVILWCVLYEDRPLAAALNTLAIHALGDACAPLAVGAIIDSSTNNGHNDSYAYNFAFGIAIFWLIFSGIAFIAAICTMNWLEIWMIRNGQTRRKTSLLINDPSH